MRPEFDPDDQFFQAFKAGIAVVSAGIKLSDKTIWHLYCAWLEEDES